MTSAVISHACMNRDHPTTSAPVGFDPWPLLPKRAVAGRVAGLRLVIHGRSGGVVPSCFQDLLMAVSDIREAPVELEVLTAEQPEPACCHEFLGLQFGFDHRFQGLFHGFPPHCCQGWPPWEAVLPFQSLSLLPLLVGPPHFAVAALNWC